MQSSKPNGGSQVFLAANILSGAHMIDFCSIDHFSPMLKKSQPSTNNLHSDSETMQQGCYAY